MNTLEQNIVSIVESILVAKGSPTSNHSLREVAQRIFSAINLEASEKVKSESFERIVRELQARVTTTVTKVQYITESHKGSWLTQERKRCFAENGYWQSYKRMLRTERSAIEAYAVDEATDTILGLMSDPQDIHSTSVKGLVIGDVQSGKTSNYAGLISKAADAGYKIIIVITGTIETLRSQTQERLERDFVGKSSNDKIAAEYSGKLYGVAAYRQVAGRSLVIPSTLTSWSKDFRQTDCSNIAPDIANGNVILLVIKKNKSVLNNVIKFFSQRLNAHERQMAPALIIDDEADNASPNSKNEDDPSAINERIRTLLSLFPRNSYVGYTATPYANIFINPYNTNNLKGTGVADSMEMQDLFPRNFIVTLGQPSNYIGATKLFCQDDEDETSEYNELANVVQTIGEESEFLDKLKARTLTSLPHSLKQALNTFVIAKALKSQREPEEKHCTMLIHVTMKQDGHTDLTKLVKAYMDELLGAISCFVSLPKPETRHNLIQNLYQTWIEQYYGTEVQETWDDLCAILGQPGFTSAFKIYTENNQTAKKLRLDYSKAPALTPIVIGGQCLSRGLTLEGLCTSYFLRDSRQYDTLMQMGRWFGYRPNYADICRIFMTERMQTYFASIAQATEELKASIQEMNNAKKSPLEFGLRVRNGISGLLVTARNKMKSAVTREEWVDFSDSLIETYKIPADTEAIAHNNKLLEDFINHLDNGPEHYQRIKNVKLNGIMWQEVRIEDVIGYISGTKDMVFSSVNESKEILIEALKPLRYMDVLLVQSSVKTSKGVHIRKRIGNDELEIPWRTPAIDDGYYYFKKNHPFSKSHEMGNLSEDEVQKLLDLYRLDHPEKIKNGESITPSVLTGHYYRRAENRKPLLMLAYMAAPSPDQYTKPEQGKQQYEYNQIVSVFGISFPCGQGGSRNKVNWTLNPVMIYREQKGKPYVDDIVDPNNEY